MHDARELIGLGDAAVAALARRGFRFDPAPLAELLTGRNAAIHSGDELRAESKRLAGEVGKAAKAGGDPQLAEALKDQARALKDQVREAEEKAERLGSALHEAMLDIPNLPSEAVPDGLTEDDAVEVRRVGAPPSLDGPRDHVELGEALGILDFARATKLSGPRFAVARGAGAALERAIATLFLDLHTRRHGYTEFSVPTLVTRETMTGTGQLPKFEADLFATSAGDRELFLIPTAEVPLTNLHSGEILDEGALPLAYTAHTPCYRSEAGSYGRDTKGILRLHQFSKVELVRICTAETSNAELELMVSHAEACLVELGLAYRLVKLAAGDISFSAQLTYDLEVWLPSQDKYREISSCSDCGQFQARRAGIRVRNADNQRHPVATLNGSGLPIGRTMAAILENYQQPDGSVEMPKALVPYLGFSAIAADGTLVS
ncbi:serine--tRNA ligase [Sporichthya sp.]|uniref:serine--tRNA ligase n=1 Tax=Sporichthya sp. TaxID=65475 RepID=UPI0017FD2AF5|nr:serine--tRNA ligase [Sporichthya sp.]MBA3744504.1 serine--tRNA ligase [Sporichthya sp.]